MTEALLYDNVSTGHHSGYLNGILGVDQRPEYHVAHPTRPTNTKDSDIWIPVAEHPLRNYRANRRELEHATNVAAAEVKVLVDLYLDHQIWVWGGGRSIRRQVHVLHHADQVSTSRTGSARLRTTYLRGVLRRMANRGAIIVVHTEKAAAVIDGVVPATQVRLVGYPVNPVPVRSRGSNGAILSLLFVGSAREEKGLDVLLAGLNDHSDLARVQVVGRQDPPTRQHLEREYPDVDIEWTDEFVSVEALHRAYISADLAVLPYRSTFGQHGGPSSVLLESLGAGIPIITTTALEGQLPPNYAGALVAEADSASALAECVKTAVKTIQRLRDGANSGPDFIRKNHSFDGYVAALSEAASATQ